jgi:hypothetical protein
MDIDRPWMKCQNVARANLFHLAALPGPSSANQEEEGSQKTNAIEILLACSRVYIRLRLHAALPACLKALFREHKNSKKFRQPHDFFRGEETAVAWSE